MKKTILPLLFITSLLLAGCETQVNSIDENKENVTTRKDVASSLLRVNSEKCTGSELTKEEFESSCNPISEQELADNIIVKAVQQLPDNMNEDEKMNVGQDIELEFYVDGKKLDIPEQTFHSFWATDYLSLGVSYKSPEDIYVYGTEAAGIPEYGYQYDGMAWQKTK